MSTPRKLKEPEQFEIVIDGLRLREGEADLGFQLVAETGIDFAKIEAEKRAAEIAAAEADKAQLRLF